MLELTRENLQDLEGALAREWLETNGLGGYASSSVLGINTRKYHGLLVAAMNPPVERALLVSRVDETLIIKGSRLEFSSSEYEGKIHPRGYRYLESVRLDPFPVFTYIVGGLKVEKTVFMVHGENTTCLMYSIESLPNGPRTSQVILEVRPIVAFRDHHALMRENSDVSDHAVVKGGAVRIRPYDGMPSLTVSMGNGRFERSFYWYRGFHYRREKESGYPHSEDLFSPGRLVFTFEDTDAVALSFSTREEPLTGIETLKENEIARRKRIVDTPVANSHLGRTLLSAADAFIVRRGAEGRSIIAGYPWFADWGRDTMISLPGLTLASGRSDDAKRIIRTFISSMDEGLIPNRFADSSSGADYNSIDATLWLFEAVRKYYDYTGDGDFITEVLPALRESLKWHLDGTKFGIKADEDGLLSGGQEGVQLTWMDAKIDDEVITARSGKAVEVNALWYNALRITAEFCSDFGGLAQEGTYDHLARTVFDSFNKQFWNHEKGCLYDYIDGDHRDDAIRPNQIFALSLTFPILEYAKWRQVIKVVQQELLTTYGLRTLSPLHPNYRGRYEGDLKRRDHAYHQGTVWPWLMGHYIRAYLRRYGRSGKTITHCFELLEPFLAHFADAGLGTMSEIFDGDPPQRPNGCFAQAWSVAEVLRTISEDLLGTIVPDTKALNHTK